MATGGVGAGCWAIAHAAADPGRDVAAGVGHRLERSYERGQPLTAARAFGSSARAFHLFPPQTPGSAVLSALHLSGDPDGLRDTVVPDDRVLLVERPADAPLEHHLIQRAPVDLACVARLDRRLAAGDRIRVTTFADEERAWLVAITRAVRPTSLHACEETAPEP